VPLVKAVKMRHILCDKENITYVLSLVSNGRWSRCGFTVDIIAFGNFMFFSVL